MHSHIYKLLCRWLVYKQINKQRHCNQFYHKQFKQPWLNFKMAIFMVISITKLRVKTDCYWMTILILGYSTQKYGLSELQVKQRVVFLQCGKNTIFDVCYCCTRKKWMTRCAYLLVFWTTRVWSYVMKVLISHCICVITVHADDGVPFKLYYKRAIEYSFLANKIAKLTSWILDYSFILWCHILMV